MPVIALTATATERVREDIIGQLDLQRGRVFLSSFDRANLSYSVQPKASSWGQLMSLLEQRRSQSTIIYCFSRQEDRGSGQGPERPGPVSPPLPRRAGTPRCVVGPRKTSFATGCPSSSPPSPLAWG